MTPDERNMLTDLANKIAQTPAPPRDPEAEDFIRTRIGNRPDALYLMTQTVLIQNMALNQAQQQLQGLQQRGSQPSPSGGGGSFLGGSGFGSNSGYSQPQQGYAPPQQQYGAPVAAAPVTGGGGGFLRGAAQTAAGVAAGALAFEGIRGLFNSFEHPGYGGGGSGFMGGPGTGGETIVNNYYDSPGSEERGTRDDYQDRFNDGPAVNDASDYTSADDTSVDDPAQFDDSTDTSFDDTGTSDDSYS